MKNILITGGTGLIGQELATKLEENNFQVGILSRNLKQESKYKQFHWNPKAKTIDSKSIRWADAVIHLAGAGIADSRWTKSRKEEIRSSRVESGKLILQELIRQNKKINTFMSASGTGYYGANTSERVYSEKDPSANDFLGKTCKEWEDTANTLKGNCERVIILRTGIVLSPNGGYLSKLSTPIKFGLGSPFGSGKQFIPWISLEDLTELYLFLLKKKNLTGVYNAVSSANDTSKSFTKKLMKHLRRVQILPKVPSLLLKLILGKRAVLLLEGSKVSNDKIKKAGFQFKYEDLKQYLKHL